MPLRVTGTEQLTRVAGALTGAAEGKKILRVMRKGIRDEVDPITREQKAGLAAFLPHRGGLAATVASEGRASVRTALSGRSVGVTLTDSWKGHDIAAIDKGQIRHPVWGRWLPNQKTQRVKPLILTRPVLKHERKIRRNIATGLDVLAAEIAKET